MDSLFVCLLMKEIEALKNEIQYHENQVKSYTSQAEIIKRNRLREMKECEEGAERHAGKLGSLRRDLAELEARLREGQYRSDAEGKS